MLIIRFRTISIFVFIYNPLLMIGHIMFNLCVSARGTGHWIAKLATDTAKHNIDFLNAVSSADFILVDTAVNDGVGIIIISTLSLLNFVFVVEAAVVVLVV